MYKVLNYLKYIGIFFLFVIVIALFTSLISLSGISSVFISKLSIILTAISFFFVSSYASNKEKEKGFILGIKLGLLFVVLLIFINFIVFKTGFSIDRFIYYTILIISSILGGSFGKNFKLKKLGR